MHGRFQGKNVHNALNNDAGPAQEGVIMCLNVE